MDSNLTCTLLIDILVLVADLRAAQQRARLPPVLLLHMDNCGRENKNHTVLGLLALLIEKGVFVEIQINYLPVGHTHAKVDQRFSRISVLLRKMDLAMLRDIIDAVSGVIHTCRLVSCTCP